MEWEEEREEVSLIIPFGLVMMERWRFGAVEMFGSQHPTVTYSWNSRRVGSLAHEG